VLVRRHRPQLKTGRQPFRLAKVLEGRSHHVEEPARRRVAGHIQETSCRASIGSERRNGDGPLGTLCRSQSASAALVVGEQRRADPAAVAFRVDSTPQPVLAELTVASIDPLLSGDADGQAVELGQHDVARRVEVLGASCVPCRLTFNGATFLDPIGGVLGIQEPDDLAQVLLAGVRADRQASERVHQPTSIGLRHAVDRSVTAKPADSYRPSAPDGLSASTPSAAVSMPRSRSR